MKKKGIKNKENLKLYAIIGLVIVLIFSMVFYYVKGNSSIDKYKADKSKKLVYPVYTKGKTSVPNINVDSTEIKTINNVIIDNANKFLTQENNTVSYDFDISGKILSLAIQYIDYHSEDGYPKITYEVYNVNYQTGKLLTKEDILALYEVTEEQVSGIIQSKFGEYYNDLTKNNYINAGECDYLCFLYLRGIVDENYLENYHYYIKNGNLYVIKEFSLYSYYKEDEYFSTKSFFIQITK